MAEVLRDFIDPSRKRTSSAKGLYTYWSDDFWNEFYWAVSNAAMDLGLTEPSRQELEEWAIAEELNDRFHKYREDSFGPNWSGLNALYFDMTYKEQVEWRKENSELYDRLKAGWLMKDAFGKDHPAWQKFYDADAYQGKETAASTVSGSGGYSMGSTVTLGNKTMRHSLAPAYARSDYSRATLEQIIKGQRRPQRPSQWPALEVSRLALQELLAGNVSTRTTEYLQELHKKALPSRSYDEFLEYLMDLAKSVIGPVEQTTSAVVWPWVEAEAVTSEE